MPPVQCWMRCKEAGIESFHALEAFTGRSVRRRPHGADLSGSGLSGRGDSALCRVRTAKARRHSADRHAAALAGNREASYRLEEYWNALIEKIPFSLLCAYFIDHLDPHLYGGPLERVCRCHSHMIPARDEAELERAVAVSTQKIMGAALSGMLGTLASTYRPRTLMPMPQATLFYLCENMPVTARKVLKKMRDERSLRNTSL